MTNPSIASDLIERGLTGKIKSPSLEPSLSERPLSSKEWRAFGIEAADALSQLTREVEAAYREGWRDSEISSNGLVCIQEDDGWRLSKSRASLSRSNGDAQ